MVVHNPLFHKKRILDIIERNPGINTRKLLKESGMGKKTFYKYLAILEDEQSIMFSMEKNQKIWNLRPQKERIDKEKIEKMVQNFEDLEDKIHKSMKKVSKKSQFEKLTVYQASVNAVLLYQNTIWLAIFCAPKRRDIPPYWFKLIEKSGKLLKQLMTKMPNEGFAFVMNNIMNTHYIAKEQLDAFLDGKLVK